MDTTTKASHPKPPMTPAQVGLLVKVYRDAMEWSQETLAELSGLTVRTVQRVEAGQPSSLDTRRALARGFQIPDLDVFSKPYPFPTPEELEQQRAEFDRNYLVLDAQKVTGRQLLAKMQDGPGYGCLALMSETDLPPAAQEVFATIADFARDCMDIFDVASRTEILGYGDTLDESIAELAAAGFCLCAAYRQVKITNKSWADPTPMQWQITYLLTGAADQPVGKVAVPRKVQIG